MKSLNEHLDEIEFFLGEAEHFDLVDDSQMVDITEATKALDAVRIEIDRLQEQCKGLAQSAMNNGQDLLLKEAEIDRLTHERDVDALAMRAATKVMEAMRAELEWQRSEIERLRAVAREDKPVVGMEAETSEEQRPSFCNALQRLINGYSKENGSDTPDFILANYLVDCLEVFNRTMQYRESWYSRPCGGGAAITS